MGFLIIQINNFWYILLQDLPAIFFYLLIAIVMHQIIQEYLLDRVNRKLHMSKVKHTKFNESGKINTISNQNRFPFPVQKNALVALMKHPTISRFFKFFIFFFVKFIFLFLLVISGQWLQSWANSICLYPERYPIRICWCLDPTRARKTRFECGHFLETRG